MQFATKREASESIPLQNAVLCVDCEFVSASRGDVCPVCGGHSLFSIARMMGGSLSTEKVDRPEVTPFDLEVTVRVSRIEPSDLTATVEAITDAIQPNLGRGRASLHVNVEPAADASTPYELRAA